MEFLVVDEEVGRRYTQIRRSFAEGFIHKMPLPRQGLRMDRNVNPSTKIESRRVGMESSYIINISQSPSNPLKLIIFYYFAMTIIHHFKCLMEHN